MTSIDWSQITYERAEKFVPPISYGKIVKVYDGDTITIATPLDGTRAPIYRFSVRLRGIDTPEIHGSTPLEKQKALEVRDALSAKVMNRMVFLKNIDMEKYGRVLADVFLEESSGSGSRVPEKISINAWMLEHHYGVAYDGGTKLAFSCETGKKEQDDEYYKISAW